MGNDPRTLAPRAVTGGHGLITVLCDVRHRIDSSDAKFFPLERGEGARVQDASSRRSHARASFRSRLTVALERAVT